MPKDTKQDGLSDEEKIGVGLGVTAASAYAAEEGYQAYQRSQREWEEWQAEQDRAYQESQSAYEESNTNQKRGKTNNSSSNRANGSSGRADGSARGMKPDVEVIAEDPYSKYKKSLGLKPNATEAEIEKAYKQAMLRNHPDRGGNQDVFQRINNEREAFRRDVEKFGKLERAEVVQEARAASTTEPKKPRKPETSARSASTTKPKRTYTKPTATRKPVAKKMLPAPQMKQDHAKAVTQRKNITKNKSLISRTKAYMAKTQANAKHIAGKKQGWFKRLNNKVKEFRKSSIKAYYKRVGVPTKGFLTKMAEKYGGKYGLKYGPKAAKFLAKKIPYAAAVVGFGLAVNEARKGNWGHAACEFASGAVGCVPGYGTLASIAIDVDVMCYDKWVAPKFEPWLNQATTSTLKQIQVQRAAQQVQQVVQQVQKTAQKKQQAANNNTPQQTASNSRRGSSSRRTGGNRGYTIAGSTVNPAANNDDGGSTTTTPTPTTNSGNQGGSTTTTPPANNGNDDGSTTTPVTNNSNQNNSNPGVVPSRDNAARDTTVKNQGESIVVTDNQGKEHTITKELLKATSVNAKGTMEKLQDAIRANPNAKGVIEAVASYVPELKKDGKGTAKVNRNLVDSTVKAIGGSSKATSITIDGKKIKAKDIQASYGCSKKEAKQILKAYGRAIEDGANLDDVLRDIANGKKLDTSNQAPANNNMAMRAMMARRTMRDFS